MKLTQPLFPVSLLAFAIAAQAGASVSVDEQKAVSEYLNRFYQNTQEVMNEVPAKYNLDGEKIEPTSVFTKEQIESNDFVLEKDAVRKDIITQTSKTKKGDKKPAPIKYNDNPARLVDGGNQLIKNIHTMDAKKLRSAKLAEQPWSDTYWPLYKGALGDRYGDPGLGYQNNWYDYWTYANQTNPPQNYVNNGNIDALSPSEKYDLLVGDSNYTLTKSMWDMGKGYFDNNGSVERWMGLCHGWAAAAYMLPRPKDTVTVKSADGVDIKFYPSDIKALGTLLWAEASPRTRFIGGRCNTKNPDQDENGRVKDQQCFDNNPGSWHQSVVNQIGVSKRSFILDATYDYQVWNQPVYQYSYTYFNPETKKAFNNAKDAMIKLADFSRDKFKSYRGNATYVVGVQMSITYMVETSATHRATDAARYDGKTQVRYTYDLELDAQGNIVGGEWYNNRHPDFLWTPGPDGRAMSMYNPGGTWQKGQPIPNEWKAYANYVSRYDQPLTSIVEQLFNWSAGQ
ncbi:hypothetical protein [Zooshikella ganghwensis]|uniref:Peptidase n=1 Tax=Zooshikella ganghwensis TaxID=202772 RepID=A0A4P9VJB9_9GAMM|nr:hypothetical protein [Zooshikella ganghwensis]RDH42434.1 peptidase [Zooshikella ganghwensis]